MAQLVERSLPIPEVRSLTPVIGKIYIVHLFVYLFIINCIEKMKINKKRPGMAHFLKKKKKSKILIFQILSKIMVITTTTQDCTKFKSSPKAKIVSQKRTAFHQNVYRPKMVAQEGLILFKKLFRAKKNSLRVKTFLFHFSFERFS